ncbi:MAG TPA: hypothetical protein VGO25_11435 [Rhodanobacteraceae bacterium]|nr:hypothetical protein [Rhodanobacteraceae bacterium]
MRARAFSPGFPVLAAVLIAACSGNNPSAPAAAPVLTVDRAQAAKSIDMYHQLLQSKSYELAAPIGQEIVAKYPSSSEAKEVQQTLADTVAKANAITARRRLERLWIYQSGKESGGQQTTASIYSSEPVSSERARLVLRRHSAWGQSAYVFGSGKGFDCESPCTVGLRFDDAPPQRVKAHLPETGEPAIFITDDRGFIAKMSKAQKASIEVLLKGKSKQTLVFEVGGYESDKFATPAKK